MIPILFAQGTTLFTTNGIGRLRDCLSCVVTEELNGIFECAFEYPTTGQHYADIAEGCIIYATHDDTKIPQPFDIYSHTKPIDGIVTFYARHISYRLNKITVRPFEASSCAQAIAAVKTYSVNTNPFTFNTDKTVASAFSLASPKGARALLGGEEGSILDIYGGEYQYDGFIVRLLTRRGNDTDVVIRYGKNLLDVTEDYDTGDTYNAVMPYWMDGETGAVTMLPEYVVSMASTLEQPEMCVPLDLSGKFETAPTVEQLRTAASDYLYDNMPWQATKGISVDFVALWQTADYANIAPLSRVALGDTVGVVYSALGITASLRVVRTDYNTLLDRYDTIELGRLQSTLSGTILTAVESSTQAALDSRPTFAQVAGQVSGEVSEALARFSGAQGGYRVDVTDANGKPTETYYLDTNNVNTAVNVLRINNNGIGFSTTGINGPYTSAWLINGTFVADFIKSGTLNANLIRAGIIQDVDGNSYWNLTSGVMSLAGQFKSTDFDVETGRGIRTEISDGVFKIQALEIDDSGESGSGEGDLISLERLQIEVGSDYTGELDDGTTYLYSPTLINAREGSELMLYCGNTRMIDVWDGRPCIRIGKYATTIYGPIKYVSGASDEWQDAIVESGITTPGTDNNGGGKLQWKQDSDRVYFRGGINCSVPSGGIHVCTVPSDLVWEGNIFSLQPCQGSRIARISMRVPSGGTGIELWIGWVRDMSNGSQYTGDVWIDLNMSFSGAITGGIDPEPEPEETGIEEG